MTFQLMRRDPAWKLALWMTLFGAFAWPFIPPARQPIEALLPTGFVFLVCAARAQAHRRATLFEAALPIGARQLFRARLLSLLSLVWLPMAAGAFTISVVRPLYGGLAVAMLECAALFSVLIVTLQSARIREFAGPNWLGMMLLAAGIPVCAVAVLYVPAGILLPVCGVAFTAIFAADWKAIPPSFQAAPVEAASFRAAGARPRLRAPVWWPIVRSVMTPYKQLFIVVILVQFISGQWVFAACFLVVILGDPHLGTLWLFGLPISHRTRLLITIMPALLPLLIGAVLGANLGILPYTKVELVRIGGALFPGGSEEPYRPGTPNVQVPVEFWRHAAGGKAPEIRAPWGETVRPSTVGVLGARLYNPYEVSRENTKEFMEWQFERATTNLYGRPIARRQYVAALGAGARSVMSTARMQILRLAAILLIVTIVAGTIQFTNWHRLGRAPAALRSAILCVLIGVPFVLFGYDFLGFGDVPGMITTHLWPLLLLYCSRALPHNLAAVVLIAATPVAVSYLAAERLAAQSELALGSLRTGRQFP